MSNIKKGGPDYCTIFAFGILQIVGICVIKIRDGAYYFSNKINDCRSESS